MKVCGLFEDWCEDKFDEAWNEGTTLGKAKAIGYGLLSGVPVGLAICGIELYTIGAIGFLTGRKLELVKK